MPSKVVAEVLLIALAGTGLFFFLLRRCLRSRKISDGVAFLLFVGVALLLFSAFIPCFNLYGTALCRGPASEKWIALTFDDGPNEPYTSQILDILKQKGVPATFFVLGENVERSPDVVRRMIREGYAVGNHTWDHAPLVLKSPEGVRNEIEAWEKAMEKVNGGLPSPKIFRAPHGWKTPWVTSLLDQKGYRLIGWTRGVWDSDRPGVDVLFNRLTRNVKNGDIILLHDGEDIKVGADRSQTVEVLPKVIDYYRGQGYRFVSLRDLLRKA